MTLPTHLALAYRAAPYEAAGATLKIGRRNPALDGILACMGVRRATLITAWNPSGRRKPPGWNARMQSRLKTALQGYPLLTATSGRGVWREEQLLVGASATRLRTLARRFGQFALVDARRGQQLRLVAVARPKTATM